MPELTSEKELETYIQRQMENKEITPWGMIYLPSDLILRQFEITGYGIADLIGIKSKKGAAPGNTELYADIVELKKGPITISAIGQVARYMTGFRRLIKKHNSNSQRQIDLHMGGYVIGTDPEDDSPYIVSSCKNISLITYGLTLDNGLSFTAEPSDGWFKDGEDFSSSAWVPKEITGED